MEKIKVMLISGKVTSEHYYPKANEAIRTMLESTDALMSGLWRSLTEPQNVCFRDMI